jgi:hypothetical protein
MTNHVVRLYALAGSLLVLFLTWAAVAAKPWASQPSVKADPRWAALAIREHKLHRESVVVQRLVAKRWQVYRVELAARRQAISSAVKQHRQQLAAVQATTAAATAPSVRVVTLPPVTVTRTS